MRFEDHCGWIVTQTELLVADLGAGASQAAPVPSCPGWTLGALLRHVGGGHRWAARIVRTRATQFLPDGIVRDVDGDDTGPIPAGWLLDGARELAGALTAAGPDAAVWTPFEAGGMPFWARRFAHETLMHRADACLAAGVPFEVGTDVALDALDEWMELDAHPVHFDLDPAKRAILGPGRTVALVAPEEGWFVDLTGDVNTWRRGTGPAAVTVRAPLRELLLLVYRRRDPDGLRIDGDADLLRHWLRHVAFG
ncbi:maleylpyruvate isomerase family mycothiol-dependent enzyme [Dactylosporangium sp. NPDC005555]|uniref:maleylpyruvate isomerase family mycothiol-dependent enzyme n=1 Tax=Dactylosporangium sp. NPDC005555 TaxID=3154889 RepID=UPI0033A4572F